MLTGGRAGRSETGGRADHVLGDGALMDDGPTVTVAFGHVDLDVLPPSGHPTILVIDDDVRSREWLAATLAVEGFDVVTAVDGDQGIATVRADDPSLVVLDMQLGDSEGLSVFRRIAAISAVPVIIVTSNNDELGAVVALEAGAADHITKPPRPRELTARIRAVLRRVGDQAAEPTPPPVLVFNHGPVFVDVEAREAVVRGESVDLSRKEFELLALLVSEGGRVVTRKQCMQRIWKDKAKRNSRTLDTHVKRLRRKIEVDSGDPQHVITVRGIGYRFKA
jgi:two-component system response regulator RegX3